MAHNLGLALTAEGADTEAQAACLTTKACDEAQGFLCSRSMSGPAVVEYLYCLGSEPLSTLRGSGNNYDMEVSR